MLATTSFIVSYIIESFIHIWPYLLITIPIAVTVQMSGMSKYIRKAFSAQPILAIFLATFVGAFSPLCSCSVIPVIAALLIGGVPLAPVMSFWLASPSMDPEIFFLTVGTLGWELAVWRLAGTLVLSLSGGFVVHILIRQGWLGEDILRNVQSTQVKTFGQVLKRLWGVISARLSPKRFSPIVLQAAAVTGVSGCIDTGCGTENTSQVKFESSMMERAVYPQNSLIPAPAVPCDCSFSSADNSKGNCQTSAVESEPSFLQRLGKETWLATTMVIKFMLLAWLVGALIQLYVPEAWISSLLGVDNAWAIILAAMLGVPVYTSNLAAMPLVSGLLANGMHPAAALAFLISGPITTLPAMSAVWGLVNRKVFVLYIGFALVSAVLLGYVYQLVKVF
jgi:uncharacterized membrane protein YraQ (UPF0718 family)